MDRHGTEDSPQSSTGAHAIRDVAVAVTRSVGFSSVHAGASQCPREVGRAEVTSQFRNEGTEN